jgi:hypothetical protein
LDDPCATLQLSPGQQSALTVQAPHAGTQLDEEQTKRAMPESAPASTAAGLGTQGTALQQSALETHACPAPTQVESVQRGTPSMSGLHVSWWQLPLQQSHDALHDAAANRHTSPFGLQALGLRHTPRTLGGAMLHDPGAS